MTKLFFSKYLGASINLRMGHSRFFVISMTLIISVCTGLFYAGYWLGQSNNVEYIYGPDGKRINVTRSHRAQFVKLKRMTQASLKRLSLHIGYLKSRVIRLNEYGPRIIKLTKADVKDFNFGISPGLGGPEKPIQWSVNSNSLMAEINRLSAIIEDRELKFAMLETMFINANLKRDAKPEGKPVRKSDGWVRMTSRFGMRIHPITRRRRFHDGIDFAGRSGAPIYTVAAGIVTASGWRGGYGYTVEVSHGDGLVSRYAHNKRLLVKVGQKISKGQKVALMGSTGVSTGTHVHYEILKDGKPISPHAFIRRKIRKK